MSKFIIETDNGTVELEAYFGWRIALHMIQLMDTVADKKLSLTEPDYDQDFVNREVSRAARILREQIAGLIDVGVDMDTVPDKNINIS